MTKFKLPPGSVSKRYLSRKYGFNSKHIRILIELGVLTVSGNGVEVDSLLNLVENEHYVTCLACGSKQAAITHRHTSMCSGLSFEQYRTQYPDGITSASMVDVARAKSEDQKENYLFEE